MQELQIRTQGFPQLISDLGVSSPLTGPFWGLLTAVSPVYLVGSSAVVQSIPPAFPFTNHANTEAADPLGGEVIVGTPPLPRGRYVLDVSYDYFNTAAAETSRIIYQVHQAGGGTAKINPINFIGSTTTGGNVDHDRFLMVDDLLQDDWFFDFQNQVQLTAAVIRMTLRWAFVAPLPNF